MELPGRNEESELTAEQLPIKEVDLDNENKNPLGVLEIIERVLGFLNLSDVKTCRLVCQKWSKAARKPLGRLSVVRFHKLPLDVSLKEFNTTFQSPATCPLTCFQFMHHNILFNSLSWTIEKFQNFFDTWRDNIKELILIRIDLLDGRKRSIRQYDLSALITPTLTKLDIGLPAYFFPNQTKFSFSLDKLQSVKIILLRYCILDIIPEIRISPAEIELDHIEFRKDGKPLKQVTINEVLDFSKLKNVKLSSENIILDMEGSISLESLDLSHIKIVNWEKCEWTIRKKFDFHYLQMKSLTKNKMKYKAIEIVGPCVNLSIVPSEIERISLARDRDEDDDTNLTRVYTDINLENLKYLRIDCPSKARIADYLKNYTQCLNLTMLDIDGFEMINCFKTSSIPINVKKIRLSGSVSFDQDQPFTLDTLILHEYDPPIVSTTASSILVKNLVWELDTYDRKNDIFNEELKDGMVKAVKLKLERFVVGPFIEVSRSKFKKSFLFRLTDKKGKYIEFKKGKGKRIEESEFKEWIKDFDSK